MQLHSLVTLIEGKLNSLVIFNGTMVAFGFSVDRLQVLSFLLELGLQKAKLTHCFNVFDNNQVLEQKKYSKVYQCESVGQKQKKEEDCVII